MDSDDKKIGDMPKSVMESYRAIPAGASLIEALNEMVAEGKIGEKEAWAVLV